MTDIDDDMMTNIIGNFVADNIVFGIEVLAHDPEEQSPEKSSSNLVKIGKFLYF